MQGREKMRRLARMADHVCVLILNPDYPDIDVKIAIDNVREVCREMFPDRMELFEMIYMSRFRRLWEQFREPEQRIEGV